VAIVAHSQGGVVARWALRWWPSSARTVADVVTLGTPHRGFAWAGLACATPAGCEPAFMQMPPGSALLRGVGTRLPTGPAWTSVASADDGLIPAPDTVLDGATNITVQRLCPGRTVLHDRLVNDPAVLALAIDAISHSGGANIARTRGAHPG